MASDRKAALGFIFVTILIDVTGWGIIIPVIPDLIKELVHGDISGAAQWGGWLTGVYAVMQFVCAPIIGNLSDRYGRRKVLLFSLFGFGIDYLITAFSPTIWWLFGGRLVAGITGASITTAMAYIADISSAQDRAKNFGLVGVAFGAGFVIGPAIGGLLGELGTRVPFMFAAGLAFLNWLYGYFVLPESLAPEHRRKFEWKRANPMGSLMQFKKYQGIIGLVVSLALVYIAAHAVQSTWNFYTIERFGWSKKMIGLSLAVVGVLVGLVQGVLIRYVNPKIGNEKSIYIGLAFYAVGLFLFAFATQSWMMFAFLLPYCLGGIAGPALQAVITNHVPRNEQGELQGGLTSVMSITTIIGPLAMTNLFSFFTNKKAPIHFAGAPFLLGGLLMLSSAIIAYVVLKKEKHLAPVHQ